MSLFKSTLTISFFTFCSRITGYIRDIFIAHHLGTGIWADAFFVAFRLPNVFRQLSAEGALNNAFVPLFSGKLLKKGKAVALLFASKAFSFMLLVLVVLVMVMELNMPAVIYVFAPGFVNEQVRFAATVDFARITFPYLVFISLVSLMSGVLNSLGRFAPGASVSIVLNVVMVLALVVLGHITHTPAHALAYGVLCAGLIQLVWMWCFLRKYGGSISIVIPRLDHDMMMLLKRMLPGIIGGGVMQISIWVNTIIATFISGAVSYLYYADRLVQFPLAIIGTAVGTVLLPSLSTHMQLQRYEAAIALHSRVLAVVLLLILPAAAGLVVLSELLVSVVFERGAFDAFDTAACAAALMIYALGLPAFVLIKLLAPMFFSRGDTKTPVKIAVLCLGVSVAISLILMGYVGHLGLAAATSFSSWLNVFLLMFFLKKDMGYDISTALGWRVIKMMLATFFMAGSVYGMKHYMLNAWMEHFWEKIAALFLLSGTGAVLFFLSVSLFNIYPVRDIVSMWRKKKIS